MVGGLSYRESDFVYEFLPLQIRQRNLKDEEAPKLQSVLDIEAKLDGNYLIEGAGGIRVPFNEENETWLEYLKESRNPVILVARSGLGTLNHTSLSLEILDLYNVPVKAVILSGPRHQANEKV